MFRLIFHYFLFAPVFPMISANEFYKAVLDGDENEVINLLERASFGTEDYNVNSFGSDLNYTFPLRVAVQEKKENIAVILIKRGADLKGKHGGRRCLILSMAIRMGLAQVVKLIIERVDVKRAITDDAKKKFTTYLHEAVASKNAAIVRLICDEKPDLEYVNDGDFTPLQMAVAFNAGKEIVRILIEAGANVNARSRKNMATALHYGAAQYGVAGDPVKMRRVADTMDLLLAQKNIEVDPLDIFGCTPLLSAAIFNNTKAFASLLAKGANVNARSWTKESIFHNFEIRKNEEMVALAKFHGFNMDSKNEWGNTPFLSAAMCGDVRAMNVLAKYGADVNAVNNNSESALRFPLRFIDQSNEMVEILLFYQFDVQSAAKTGKPLDLETSAPRKNNEKLFVRALFESGFVFTDQQLREYFRDFCSLASRVVKDETYANFQQLFFKVAKTYLDAFDGDGDGDVVINADLFHLVKEYENKGVFTLYKILKRFYNVNGPSGEFEIEKFALFDEALVKITEGTYLERFPLELPFDIVISHNYYAWKLERLSFNVAFACNSMNLSLDEGKKLIRRVISLNLL